MTALFYIATGLLAVALTAGLADLVDFFFWWEV